MDPGLRLTAPSSPWAAGVSSAVAMGLAWTARHGLMAPSRYRGFSHTKEELRCPQPPTTVPPWRPLDPDLDVGPPEYGVPAPASASPARSPETLLLVALACGGDARRGKPLRHLARTAE